MGTWFTAFQQTPPGCILAPIHSLEDFEFLRTLNYPNGPAFTGPCGSSFPGGPQYAHLGIWKPIPTLIQDSTAGAGRTGNIANWQNLDCTDVPEVTTFWQAHFDPANGEPSGSSSSTPTILNQNVVGMFTDGMLTDYAPSTSSAACYALYMCCSTRADAGEDIQTCLDVTQIGEL